eukprot:5089189-Pyramimonas_sp.AAC.1
MFTSRRPLSYSWSVLGRSWAVLETCRNALGAMLGRLGHVLEILAVSRRRSDVEIVTSSTLEADITSQSSDKEPWTP